MKKALFACLVLVTAAWGLKIENWGGLSCTGVDCDIFTGLKQTFGDTTLGLDNIVTQVNGPFLMPTGQGWGKFGILTVGAWGGGFIKNPGGENNSLAYGTGGLGVGLGIEPFKWLLIKPELQLAGSYTLIEARFIYAFANDTSLNILKATLWQANAGASLTLQGNIPLKEEKFLGIFVTGGYLLPVYPSPLFTQDPTGICGPYLTAGLNLGKKTERVKENLDEEKQVDLEGE